MDTEPKTYAVVGLNMLTGNEWDMDEGLTRAEADERVKGYRRLEFDYKITYETRGRHATQNA